MRMTVAATVYIGGWTGSGGVDVDIATQIVRTIGLPGQTGSSVVSTRHCHRH